MVTHTTIHHLNFPYFTRLHHPSPSSTQSSSPLHLPSSSPLTIPHRPPSTSPATAATLWPSMLSPADHTPTKCPSLPPFHSLSSSISFFPPLSVFSLPFSPAVSLSSLSHVSLSFSLVLIPVLILSPFFLSLLSFSCCTLYLFISLLALFCRTLSSSLFHFLSLFLSLRARSVRCIL